jgi:hypothetical protein
MKTKNLRSSRFAVVVSLIMAGGLLLPVVASATPISFYNDATNTSSTARFTLGCGSATGDCSGQLEAVFSDSPLVWSSLTGQMFDIAKASPDAEMAFVNGVLNTTFTANSGNVIPGNLTEFQLNAEYFLIKIGTGPAYALLHNLYGNLDLYLTATPGQGAGLSHYITFGTTQVSVPEPGVLGMFGLGALLAGLFVGSRRRVS